MAVSLSPRVRELDAVRGLAALAVVFQHSATVFPAFFDGTRSDGLTLINVIKYSPLHLAFLGFPAVMIFFVLSGYVLTLQINRGDGKTSYRSFLVRRVCRIWIPYIAAVAVALTVSLPFVGETNPLLSSWFNAKWTTAPDLGVILNHFLLIGSFANGEYNPVLWSLVHEMRISLVFPVIVAVVALLGPPRAAVAALGIGIVAYAAERVVLTDTDYWGSLQFLLCFVLGILLASHREAVHAWAIRLRGRTRAALWTAAVLLLSWQAWLPSALFPQPIGKAVHLTIVDIIAVTAGAGLLLVLVQSGAPQRFLLRRIPQFLGKISYSLYLVHAVVLLAVLHLADPSTNAAVVALLPPVWALSIGLATVFQRWVEVPAQKLGRRLTRPRGGAPVPTPV